MALERFKRLLPIRLHVCAPFHAGNYPDLNGLARDARDKGLSARTLDTSQSVAIESPGSSDPTVGQQAVSIVATCSLQDRLLE